MLEEVEGAIGALVVLLNRVSKDWKKLDNRVLGNILRSPPITLGVGEHRFTEDWGVFQINQDKLGEGFRGNKLDLGTFRPSTQLRPSTNQPKFFSFISRNEAECASCYG